jgi:Spy/CpxP family protein refolding chaperone
MTRRAYVYFALTFLLGIILGGAGAFFLTWYTGHWHMRFSRQRFVGHMQHELNLSDDQVRQLKQIMDDADAKFRELRKQTSPGFDKLREELHDRIRSMLTSEQAVKFDDLVRRHEERMKRRPPPGPGPPP